MKGGLIKIKFNGNNSVKFNGSNSDVFYLSANSATRLHDNGKIEKLLNLNYVACLNLLEESDVSTNYMYIIEESRIIVKDFKATGEFIVISTNSIFFYTKTGIGGNFKYMTSERFNRIKDLCTDLVNKYKV